MLILVSLGVMRKTRTSKLQCKQVGVLRQSSVLLFTHICVKDINISLALLDEFTKTVLVHTLSKKRFVRSGIRTHAHIRGPEYSPTPVFRQVVTLESGALDHSAILTYHLPQAVSVQQHLLV